MSMIKVNPDVLYGAYEYIASTPEKEDVYCGLMISADRCGYSFGKDDDMKNHREFIGRHMNELVKAFHTSKEAFFAAVEKGMAEDNAEDDAVLTNE